MGSAYTALAQDAYAPAWNPGGLGSIRGDSVATQYVSYLDSIQYEYLSYVHPLASTKALGVSIQYLGSGNMTGMTDQGIPTGDFSTHFASYNLAYGQAITDRLALGITGKWINAAIADVSANAFAVDFGSIYRLSPHLTLGSTLTNLGSKLTFLSAGDSLPLAFHAGGVYEMPPVSIAMEGVIPQNGLNSFHIGMEWNPMPEIALRAGYRTDTVQGLSPLSGATFGIGLTVWNQEFSYAWLPMGDLGNTNYFSFVFHFGTAETRRNLIYYRHLRHNQDVQTPQDLEYQNLIQLLSEEDIQVAHP